jgi:hypothetical protein
LKFFEVFIGAVVEARQGAFIADEEGQGVGLILENESQAAQVGDGFEFLVDFFLGEGEFVFEQAGFERGYAAEAPAGEGHGLDQVHFDSIGGLVGVLVGLEEAGEVLFGFAGEDDGLGGHAVLEGVAGGVYFALRSDGAARFLAVLAGSVGS